MAGASAAINGEGIVLGNPASQKINEFLFSASQNSSVKGMNRFAFSVHRSSKNLSLETGLQRFGDQVASMDLIYAGVSHKVGSTSLGARMNLDQFRAEEFITQHSLSFSVGVITRLNKYITVGAYADHLSLSSDPGYKAVTPVRLAAGLTFDLSKDLITAVSVFQELNKAPVLRTGLEYHLVSSVDLRLGNSFFPAGIFGGAGVTYWNLAIDLAGSYRKHEGIVIQATAGYRYNRHKR